MLFPSSIADERECAINIHINTYAILIVILQQFRSIYYYRNGWRAEHDVHLSICVLQLKMIIIFEKKKSTSKQRIKKIFNIPSLFIPSKSGTVTWTKSNI